MVRSEEESHRSPCTLNAVAVDRKDLGRPQADRRGATVEFVLASGVQGSGLVGNGGIVATVLLIMPRPLIPS